MGGTAGRTHCGRWTRNVPKHLHASRLVCTLKRRHEGDHISGWSGYGWTDGERPTKRIMTAGR